MAPAKWYYFCAEMAGRFETLFSEVAKGGGGEWDPVALAEVDDVHGRNTGASHTHGRIWSSTEESGASLRIRTAKSDRAKSSLRVQEKGNMSILYLTSGMIWGSWCGWTTSVACMLWACLTTSCPGSLKSYRQKILELPSRCQHSSALKSIRSLVHVVA